MSDTLNTQQNEAVNKTDGPLLVLAGAGTGKTKVLTSRIVNIVNKNLATPLEILAVTFTNKAAAEMRNRISGIIGPQVNNIWVGTFHSLAAKITRRHAEIVGLKSDFIIIDQDDQLRLLKQIITDFNIDTKQFPAKNYLHKISQSKDVKLPGRELEAQFSDADQALPKLASVFNNYQRRLKSMNAADFGDLLSYNLEIFTKSPETLNYYQNKFRYVLVDEYQDTNNVQYQWLLRISALHQNICAVGDDDQSIYSWRGANIANILRFEKDFKQAKVIRLEQNYRSTGKILDAAHSVISNNKERHGKKLWTDKGKGEEIKLYSYLDDRSEAKNTCQTIRKYLNQQKYHPSQIAILVRAGYQTRAFEEAFIKASISYKIIGGMKFYERQEIKDAICYLRCVCNHSDDLAFNRIINTPKRSVGTTTVNKLYAKVKSEGISLFQATKNAVENSELKGKTGISLNALTKQIERWAAQIDDASLSDVTRTILEESGYIKMWQAENSLDAQGRIENIDEFLSSLNDFDNIVDFLEYVSLVEAKDGVDTKDSVSVMTVHGAKGLEFDLVFIPGLEDSIFPSHRSLEERNGIEEERRLLYVAITRAKKELIISYTKSRFLFGDFQQSAPSRFIQELPKDIKAKEIGHEDSFSGYRGSASGGYGSGSSGGGGGSNNYYKKSTAGGSSGGYGSGNQYAQQKSLGYSLSSGLVSKVQQVKTSSSGDAGEYSGKRVFHEKFGYGKVLNVDSNKIEVNFEKTGKKTIMKNFVKIV